MNNLIQKHTAFLHLFWPLSLHPPLHFVFFFIKNLVLKKRTVENREIYYVKSQLDTSICLRQPWWKRLSLPSVLTASSPLFNLMVPWTLLLSFSPSHSNPRPHARLSMTTFFFSLSKWDFFFLTLALNNESQWSIFQK